MAAGWRDEEPEEEHKNMFFFGFFIPPAMLALPWRALGEVGTLIDGLIHSDQHILA